MALQKDFTKGNSSLIIKNGYAKICCIEYLAKKSATILIRIFAIKDDSDNNKEAVEEVTVSTSSEDFNNYFSVENLNQLDSNIIKQGYNFLKTLPKFQDSTDI